MCFRRGGAAPNSRTDRRRDTFLNLHFLCLHFNHCFAGLQRLCCKCGRCVLQKKKTQHGISRTTVKRALSVRVVYTGTWRATRQKHNGRRCGSPDPRPLLDMICVKRRNVVGSRQVRKFGAVESKKYFNKTPPSQAGDLEPSGAGGLCKSGGNAPAQQQFDRTQRGTHDDTPKLIRDSLDFHDRHWPSRGFHDKRLHERGGRAQLGRALYSGGASAIDSVPRVCWWASVRSLVSMQDDRSPFSSLVTAQDHATNFSLPALIVWVPLPLTLPAHAVVSCWWHGSLDRIFDFVVQEELLQPLRP